MIDPLLVAEVETAMRLPRCVQIGCLNVASWSLVAPCGHASGWCDICHLDVSERVQRRVESGSHYVCWGDGHEGYWAEFKWEAMA
jgi:hypothetical protein